MTGIQKLSLIIVLSVVNGCSIVHEPLAAISARHGVGLSNFSAELQLTAEELVAKDIVGALVQIEPMSPSQVDIQVSDPSTSFDISLQAALSTAGYGQPSLEADKQSFFTMTAISHNNEVVSETSESVGRTYQVEVGDIKIIRDYLFDQNRVVPQSHLYLKGADSTNITLDDSIFFEQKRKKPVNNEHQYIAVVTSDDRKQEAPDLKKLMTQTTKSQMTSTVASTADSLLSLARAEQMSLLSVGDSLQVSVETIRDARVHCYYQDGAGVLIKLFPNRFTPDSMVRSGEALYLPDATDKWQLKATLPGKHEKFMCIAVDPQSVDSLSIMPQLPDLRPLPEKEFLQIFAKYQQAVSSGLEYEIISFAVN